MKTLIILITGGIILCITPVFAGIYKNATITGRIIKFDKKTVTLSQGGGRRTVVSRKSIPEYYKIEAGNNVSATVPSSRMLAAIKEAKNKRSQESKNKKSQSNHSK